MRSVEEIELIADSLGRAGIRRQALAKRYAHSTNQYTLFRVLDHLRRNGEEAVQADSLFA